MNLQPAYELLLFSAQTLFLVFAAYLIVRFFLHRTQPVDFHLSLIVIYFSLVVPLTTVLGLFGLLFRAYMLMGAVLVFLICVMAAINRVMTAPYLWSPYHKEKAEPNIGWLVSILAVTLCGAGLASALVSPPVEHDVMTYHLFFPARWIQEGRLFYLPSVFGDLAPTYSPENGELTFAFLSLPFGRDTLSRAGQFPFLVMAILAIYLLARQLGASAKAATVPVALAILSPVVFRQGFSAEVDLAMGAAFAACLYFLACYRKQPDLPLALLFGLSLGLFLGTKYVAITLSPLLILPFVYYAIWQNRTKSGTSFGHLAVAGFAAMVTGGFWYVRNWIVTGNPLFPLDLQPFFYGVYDRAAMNQSAFHIPEAKYILPVWVHAYGPAMALVAACALAVGILWILRRKATGFTAYVYLLPLLLALVHFGFVPYNSQYRFLIPAVLLSYLPLAVLEETPRLRWPARGFWGLFLLINLVGIGRSISIGSIPISGMGLVPKAYLIHFILLLAATGLAFFLIRKLKFTAAVALAGSFLICFAIAYFLMPLLFSGHPRQVVAVRSNLSPEYPVKAWAQINTLPAPAVVAYSGNNVPYYLLGDSWQHTALYVNICGPDDFLLHDFFQQCRTLPNCPSPAKTDKPGYLWRLMDRDAWLKNLRYTGAEYLFVTRMNPMEAAYLLHDKEGFPIERAWADERDDLFTLQGDFPNARLYKIERSGLFNRILKGKED